MPTFRQRPLTWLFLIATLCLDLVAVAGAANHESEWFGALALGQISPQGARALLIKEIVIALLNGLVWGGIFGVFAALLYHSIPLGVVMTAAMTLNLLVAAVFGVFIPMLMLKLNRDPAVGSSVLITALTDSGGFFIFLGLATLFLL